MITPLAKLRKELTKSKLDTVLISSRSNIVYLTNYSGFSKEEREAYLFITKNKQYILTDGRYSEAVKQQIKNFELIEISSKLPFEKKLKEIIKKHKIKKIGFEGDNTSFLEHKKLSHLLNDLNHFTLSRLRSIKTVDEISKIEKACRLGDKTFSHVLKKIKLGISEKELAFEIEFFIKKQSADISFPPIVAFGKNSSIPHHVPTNNQLTNNQIILLDFGVKLNNYCSDMTRTIFFGSATKEFKKIYNTVLEAQNLAIQQFNKKTIKKSKKQIKASEIDKVARDHITSKGYPSIPHSVGHGIGIDVHESPHLSPKSTDILKEGMVFSIEPGICIPNFGGVRVEDVFYLNKGKLEQLTHSPKTLIEI